jgi:hypothetical protein
MTREDIIRMAREICDLYRGDPYDKDCGTITMYPEELERIIAQAVEAEREAILAHCEAVCKAQAAYGPPPGWMQLMDFIRARGSK